IVAGAGDAMAKAAPRESRWPVVGFALATVVLIAGAGLVGWRLRGGGETPVVAEAAPLTVNNDGTATTLDIGDARIASDPLTRYTVTRPGTGVLISMMRGKVGLEVGKRGNRDPLIVHAGDTDVIVVGTQFTVDYDGTGEVDVRVTEGVVKVVRAQKETRIAAGEAWQTTRGKIALAEAGPSRGHTIAAVDHTADVVIPVVPGKEIGLHDRTSRVPESRIPTTGIASGSGEKHIGTPEITRLPVAPQGTPTAQLQQDTLTRLKALPVLPAIAVNATDATRAISILREQSLKTGPGASAAFYSIAVHQHLKLGRDSDAESTLDAYVRRFRGGAEYKAALWLRVRIKCLRRVDDNCRQAAFTYAHEDPGTPAGELAGTLSTLTSD
nr:FecR domain-containing protein [Deltaproteobacteria bacterium]